MAKILIVDDSVFMRKILCKMVIELGHEVVGEAGNGAEGVTVCEEVVPDLVTLDITMPEMNGIQAAREIRKMNSQVKIIMCSAMGQQRMIIEAIEAGANDFVVKPFQKDRIQAAIDKVLS
jgi:two-component system chemotaxis response regulator CheY